MERTFDGKVALVTGASGGIGAETARHLARQGARVAVVARRDEQSQAVVEQIRDTGGQAVFVCADVSNRDSVEGMVHEVVAWGGGLDIAVNNAAILGDPGASTADLDPRVWDEVIQTNLYGLFYCLQAEIRVMRDNGGAIVNVLSTGALRAAGAVAPYVASKHAGLGLTYTAAHEEIKNGIRINALCPGGTQTDMADMIKAGNPSLYDSLVAKYPIGRFATPAEQAAVIAFLCGPDSSFIVGAPILTDGGFLLV
ncbi:SDR family oxidoreductase [Streptomyces sp. SID13031]|uniref:SDR family NAD(P)-dependent oxidoreductase n=1 Tax=Streptomyces sp. SID13031 TaxID=2706046 RepID=UPI0013C72E07|nr:SDR family oxidoreductase [Streptomyces sp. SID13031]NEA36874.1 SDR family oxidoreductase [Streptomyces sp. SID13031]